MPTKRNRDDQNILVSRLSRQVVARWRLSRRQKRTFDWPLLKDVESVNGVAPGFPLASRDVAEVLEVVADQTSKQYFVKGLPALKRLYSFHFLPRDNTLSRAFIPNPFLIEQVLGKGWSRGSTDFTPKDLGCIAMPDYETVKRAFKEGVLSGWSILPPQRMIPCPLGTGIFINVIRRDGAACPRGLVREGDESNYLITGVSGRLNLAFTTQMRKDESFRILSSSLSEEWRTSLLREFEPNYYGPPSTATFVMKFPDGYFFRFRMHPKLWMATRATTAPLLEISVALNELERLSDHVDHHEHEDDHEAAKKVFRFRLDFTTMLATSQPSGVVVLPFSFVF